MRDRSSNDELVGPVARRRENDSVGSAPEMPQGERRRQIDRKFLLGFFTGLLLIGSAFGVTVWLKG